MGNGLKADWNKLTKDLEELKKKEAKQEPRISLGEGPKFSTSGGTASQDIARYYRGVDTSKLSPFAIETMGGEKKIAERKEAAKKLIESETPPNKPPSVSGTKPPEAKPPTKPEDKELQAIEERLKKNKDILKRPEFTFLPSKADVWEKSPTGGEIKVGYETLKRAKELRAKRAEEIAAKEAGMLEKQGRAKEALKSRYEEGLAKRGFAPPKTKEEQDAITRSAREEFDIISAARKSAEIKDKNAIEEHKNYTRLARYYRRAGDPISASYYNQQALKLESELGGNIRDNTKRRKSILDREMQIAKDKINEFRNIRIQKMQKQSTSTPEASTSTPEASTSTPEARTSTPKASISGYKDFISGTNQESPFLTYKNIFGVYDKGTNPFSKYAKKIPQIGEKK